MSKTNRMSSGISRKRALLIAVIAVVLVWAAAVWVVWSRGDVRNAAKWGIQETPFWVVSECSEARKNVKEEVEKIWAAGEPTTLAEIVPAPVPEDENAAVIYEKAFEALDGSENEKDTLWDLSAHLSDASSRELPSMAAVTRIVRENSEAISLLEEAAERDRCRFDVNWQLGLWVRKPHLLKLKYCGKLLEGQAIAEAESGEPEEALGAIDTGVGIYRALESEPGPLSRLTRRKILRGLLGALRFTLQQTSPSRAKLHGLNTGLAGLDIHKAWYDSVVSERVMVMSLFEQLKEAPEKMLELVAGDGAGDLGLSSRLAMAVAGKCLIARDEALYLELSREVLAAAKEPHRRCHAELKRIDEQLPGRLKEQQALVTAEVFPVFFARYAGRRDEVIAEIRLAQAALALEAYRNGTGCYPELLSAVENVVEWAELSEDPFSGEELRYRREGEGFVMYSFGSNLENNSGQASERWNEGDIVWRVGR